MKVLTSGFLITIIIGSLVLICVSSSTVQGSEVIGVIHSDTTWTLANSPYTLTGPVAVLDGSTLTIEPGVVVNLGSYYLQINGTLHAKGTSANKINFTGTAPERWAITFTPISIDWKPQSNSGSIIENVVITLAPGGSKGISIENASPLINNNTITAYYGIDVFGGSPTIANNVIYGQIGIHVANPTITGNFITAGVSGVSYYKGATITPAVIANNTISCRDLSGRLMTNAYDYYGIEVRSASLSGNTISGFQTGIYTIDNTIEQNLIVNNKDGICILSDYENYHSNATIRYNTITNNFQGINITQPDPGKFTTIDLVNNNIYNNQNYNVYSASSNNVAASSNWWGTNDTQAINQTIRDGKNDFNVGMVNFIPFLTDPVSQAPQPNMPLPPLIYPTPSGSPTPLETATATPTQPSTSSNLDWTSIAIITLLSAAVALLLIDILYRRKRNPEKKSKGA
jgi:hypothetical protein